MSVQRPWLAMPVRTWRRYGDWRRGSVTDPRNWRNGPRDHPGGLAIETLSGWGLAMVWTGTYSWALFFPLVIGSTLALVVLFQVGRMARFRRRHGPPLNPDGDFATWATVGGAVLAILVWLALLGAGLERAAASGTAFAIAAFIAPVAGWLTAFFYRPKCDLRG